MRRVCDIGRMLRQFSFDLDHISFQGRKRGRSRIHRRIQSFQINSADFYFLLFLILINAASRKPERRLVLLSTQTQVPTILWRSCGFNLQSSSCRRTFLQISGNCGRIPFSINIYLSLMKWELKWALRSPMLNMWCDSVFRRWAEYGLSSCVSLFSQWTCNWDTAAADEIPSESPSGNCLLTLPVCNWVLSLILTGSSCEVTPFNKISVCWATDWTSVC